MKNKMDKKYKKILIIVGIVIASIILLLVIIGVGVYKYNWNNSFTKALPYPAAIVDGKIITYSDWQNKVSEYEKNKNFYLEEQEIDLKALDLPGEKEVKEQALEDLIKKQILNSLAKEYNVQVTDQDIDKAYEDLILKNVKQGAESAETTLEQLYGMSVDDFKDEVIYDYVLQADLETKVQEAEGDKLNQLAKQKIEQALDGIKNEQDFEDTARMYNDDNTALTGGDMGYIGRGEMMKFYEDTVWSLEVGNMSDIIETPDGSVGAGFYIIKVEDEKENEGEIERKVRHIYIQTNLDKLLDDKMRNANVWRWVKNF